MYMYMYIPTINEYVMTRMCHESGKLTVIAGTINKNKLMTINLSLQ